MRGTATFEELNVLSSGQHGPEALNTSLNLLIKTSRVLCLSSVSSVVADRCVMLFYRLQYVIIKLTTETRGGGLETEGVKG